MKPTVKFLRFTKFSKVLLLNVALIFAFQSFSSLASNYLDESDILYSSPDNGEKVVHDFTDFNADILLAALRKQRLGNVMLNLSRKYGLSEDECRRKIKHSINVLEEWEIILQTE
jgi:hypothetical protein